jgi:hypothetical protein
MPSDEIEEAYAPQFSPTTGPPAKPARLAFGELFIKQRLCLSHEETVEQIRENTHMQFFLGFARYSSKTPFDPSMMVHSHKLFPEEGLNRITELIVERGKAMVMEAVESASDEHNSDDPGEEQHTAIRQEIRVAAEESRDQRDPQAAAQCRPAQAKRG